MQTGNASSPSLRLVHCLLSKATHVLRGRLLTDSNFTIWVINALRLDYPTLSVPPFFPEAELVKAGREPFVSKAKPMQSHNDSNSSKDKYEILPALFKHRDH